MTELTAARVREVLNFDPDTGILTWSSSRGRAKRGAPAGCQHSDGYINVCVDGKLYPAHRVAWLHFHGAWPLQQIDHINGIRSDNRIANLRDVSQSANNHNIRRPQSGNSTGVRGVSWSKRLGQYEVQFSDGGKKHYVGIFRTLHDAEEAYASAKRSLVPAA